MREDGGDQEGSVQYLEGVKLMNEIGAVRYLGNKKSMGRKICKNISKTSEQCVF